MNCSHWHLDQTQGEHLEALYEIDGKDKNTNIHHN